jgi:hypothetical protein
MIVGVRFTNPTRTEYFNMPNYSDNGNDRDKARKIAFRYAYGRRETDFNELVHNTTILDVVELNSQVQEVVMRMA